MSVLLITCTSLPKAGIEKNSVDESEFLNLIAGNIFFYLAVLRLLFRKSGETECLEKMARKQMAL